MGTTPDNCITPDEEVAERLRSIPGIQADHVAVLTEAADGVTEVVHDIVAALEHQSPRQLVRTYKRGRPCWSAALTARWLDRFDALEPGHREIVLGLAAFAEPLPWEVVAAAFAGGHRHLLHLSENGWLRTESLDGAQRVRCWRPWALVLRTERSEALESARARLLDHTVAEVDAWEMDWHRGDVAIDELVSLRTLLTAAHDRAIRAADAAEAYRILGFLGHVLWCVGPQDEGHRRTEETLNLPGLEPFQRVMLQAKVLERASHTDLPAAQGLVDECDDHANQPDWRGPTVRALRALATHAFRAGDHDLAAVATRRFMTVPGLADTDRMIARCVGPGNLEALGRAQEAVRLLEEGRAEAERLGLVAVRYMMATSLSSLLIDRGDLRSGIALIEETLREPMPSRGSHVALLTNLGGAYLFEGRLEEGRDVLERAVAFQRASGLHHQLGRCQVMLGECYSGLGHHELADRTLAAGVRQVTALHRLHIGMAALGMAWQARNHARIGDAVASRRAAESARAAIEQDPDVELAVHAVLLHAEWLLSGGTTALRKQVVELVRQDRPGLDVDTRRELGLLTGLEEADLEVTPEGTVRYDDRTIDLSRFRANREIFLALARAHHESPGVGCRVEALVQAAWPDQNLAGDSGNRRVYTAMGALRKVGLDSAIERAPEGGYRLRPDLVLRWT